MDSYNISPDPLYDHYFSFCKTDEDCENNVEPGSACKEGIGVLDIRQHNWFQNTGCGKKYNLCRFLARKDVTIVNKNYHPVKSPFYAVEIKCYDNDEITFEMVQ